MQLITSPDKKYCDGITNASEVEVIQGNGSVSFVTILFDQCFLSFANRIAQKEIAFFSFFTKKGN